MALLFFINNFHNLRNLCNLRQYPKNWKTIEITKLLTRLLNNNTLNINKQYLAVGLVDIA